MKRPPPHPVWPVVKEQGARFWLRLAGMGVLAAAFVLFFAWRSFVAAFPDVDQHAEDVRVHEQHLER